MLEDFRPPPSQNIFHGVRVQSFMRLDLVIFACSDFREFVILGVFVMSRICELSISMIGSFIIIIMFARFLNSQN